MAKILQFRRVKKNVPKSYKEMLESDCLEDDVNAIMNDFSLTPANRRWILENMLMDIDDQLQAYKRELEKAERQLDKMVRAAEKDIATAYSDFERKVRGMTHAVDKLTRTRRPQLEEAVHLAAKAEQQGTP